MRDNVATGTFGTWDETGRNIHIALLAGGLGGEGYGTALGRFIAEDGTMIPRLASWKTLIRSEPAPPAHRRAGRAPAGDPHHGLPPGRIRSNIDGSTPRSCAGRSGSACR